MDIFSHRDLTQLQNRAEAEWFYQEVDQDEELFEEISTIEQETNGTDTHLIIRYRF